jgi:signal transduction histidine kinase
MIFTLANHAAVVIARQLMAEEAKEQARQTAILDERNRLARDVHDTLSRAFTGIKFLLEAANRIDSPEQTANCICQARNLAIEGAQEARRSVMALRPAALEVAGNLVDALRKLGEQKSGTSDVIIDVSIIGEQQHMSAAVEDNSLRICQEAITNSQKHSGASKVTVEVSFSPQSLHLKIEDNGRGFDRNKVSGGFGLTSMSERAALIGGEIAVHSAKSKGTKIVVRVPLTAETRK